MTWCRGDAAVSEGADCGWARTPRPFIPDETLWMGSMDADVVAERTYTASEDEVCVNEPDSMVFVSTGADISGVDEREDGVWKIGGW